jgi:hypothetical protein
LAEDQSFIPYGTGGAGEWIQTNNIGLFAYVVTSGTEKIIYGTSEHCNSWQNIQKHTYISLSKKGTNIGFLSVLYPSSSRSYISTSTEYFAGMPILLFEKNNWHAISFTNVYNAMIDTHGIKTDAANFFMKYTSDGIEYIFADGVTKLYINGTKIMQSEKPTTIAIKYTGGNMDITYKDNGNIEVYQNSTNIIYNSQSGNFLSNNGILGL